MKKSNQMSIFGIYKRLIKRVKEKDKSIFFYFFIYTVASSIFPLIAIIIPKIVIEYLQSGKQFNEILNALLIFVIASCVLGFISGYTQQIGYFKTMKLRIDYCADLSKKIINQDYHYCEEPDYQDKIDSIWKAIGNNADGVEGIYHKTFTLFAFIFSSAFYIYLIGSLSVYILLSLIASVTVTLIVSSYIKKLQYKHKEEISHSSRRMNFYQNVSQDFSYGKDIRLFRLKDVILSKYDGQIANYVTVFKKIYNKEYRVGFFELLVLLIQDGVIYGVLVMKLFKGEVSVGDFSMYLAASIALSTSLRMIINDITTIYNDSMYVSDYYAYMEKEDPLNDNGLKAIKDDTLEIEFKNVSFKYPKTEKYIYKNLNFKINKGEKIAIVGVNGAGKTTLVKLITRLFDVEEGEILVNNINIKEFNLQEYFKMFSIVFQDVNIFAYTIRENIAISNDKSNDEKIWDCLKRVGLENKIRSLERGLDTMMLKVIDDNGIELSGGESQKLAIARALYKDANMVILDEPTAALDALAEASIYQSFNDLVQDKTAIYISHRLASTKFCDRIILFGNEGILEQGSHDELMALKGEYYNMFVTQGKYYQEEQQQKAGVINA
jgi:ATP-binding cassette subfamily B protein/ATP-binding cassette subfamily C protein